MFLVRISLRALSMAISAELLLGDRANSMTIVARGIRASGSPRRRAQLMAASTLGPIPGLARPMSS